MSATTGKSSTILNKPDQALMVELPSNRFGGFWKSFGPRVAVYVCKNKKLISDAVEDLAQQDPMPCTLVAVSCVCGAESIRDPKKEEWCSTRPGSGMPRRPVAVQLPVWHMGLRAGVVPR